MEKITEKIIGAGIIFAIIGTIEEETLTTLICISVAFTLAIGIFFDAVVCFLLKHKTKNNESK